MRTEINKINIKGRVVIGEGEMDKLQCYLLEKMWVQELVKKSI